MTEATAFVFHVPTIRRGTLRTGRVVYHVHCSCSWRWPRSFETEHDAEVCFATRHAINGQMSIDYGARPPAPNRDPDRENGSTQAGQP